MHVQLYTDQAANAIRQLNHSVVDHQRTITGNLAVMPSIIMVRLSASAAASAVGKVVLPKQPPTIMFMPQLATWPY